LNIDRQLQPVKRNREQLDESDLPRTAYDIAATPSGYQLTDCDYGSSGRYSPGPMWGAPLRIRSAPVS
jgi:hypothetical protein